MGLEAKLISEKKILVAGVKSIHSVKTFLPWRRPRPDLVKNLFEVALVAIEAFQESPTALITFPSLLITDSRVMGGWVGSPWGPHNEDSLSAHFHEINPWFNIRIVSVEEVESELHYCGQREIAIHFTYKGIHS